MTCHVECDDSQPGSKLVEDRPCRHSKQETQQKMALFTLKSHLGVRTRVVGGQNLLVCRRVSITKDSDIF